MLKFINSDNSNYQLNIIPYSNSYDRSITVITTSNHNPNFYDSSLSSLIISAATLTYVTSYISCNTYIRHFLHHL